MTTQHQSNQPLQQGGLSRAEEVLKFVPFGKTTLWNWAKCGKFPAPIKLTATMTVWRNDDVNAWLANPTGWHIANASTESQTAQ